MKAPLPDDWAHWLGAEFEADYMASLKRFLADEKAQRKEIYPHSSNWFRAFELTPLSDVKVVILGQDPYHGPHQAHGLSFSVQPGIPVPPSLGNIYKELASDLGVRPVGHGHLEAWARQGVLLLNTALTVERGNAGSHRGKGWEPFTDRAVEIVSAHAKPCVFILWGSHARQKKALIDRQRHCIIESPHPSPLSAHRGFFGTRPFSQANAFLQAQGRAPIEWQLPQTP
ncbi:uracil-DNA glycosylase [Halomonas dongshanensis]|uniref:Uracil-DNA glycosylase n=1 Tax=Halomonas dongshanensis TaxID=2890835 RepID=A0ABT2EF19_9GAMM|nr:uracil-DNA glycosylase [Halomonas dongshanensis]MCS2610181.1 uracil-DNA glycosylase [Halomonas dongshanensis]